MINNRKNCNSKSIAHHIDKQNSTGSSTADDDSCDDL